VHLFQGSEQQAGSFVFCAAAGGLASGALLAEKIFFRILACVLVVLHPP